MDEELKALLKTADGKSQLEINHEKQTVALVDQSGQAGETQPVKPLQALYGKGTGQNTVIFDDERFYPLLLAIEEVFFDAYSAHSTTTDGDALAALDLLCMTPEANVQHNPLAFIVQFSLRVALSLNDFSRQDVKLCLRKVKQSVNRHTKLAGVHGYLDFIKQQFSAQAE